MVWLYILELSVTIFMEIVKFTIILMTSNFGVVGWLLVILEQQMKVLPFVALRTDTLISAAI